MNLYRGILEGYWIEDIQWDFEAENDSIAQAIVDERALKFSGVIEKKLYLIGKKVK